MSVEIFNWAFCCFVTSLQHSDIRILTLPLKMFHFQIYFGRNKLAGLPNERCHEIFILNSTNFQLNACRRRHKLSTIFN